MSADIARFLAAQDLILRFWAVVDETDDTAGADLFAADGALVIESFRAAGPEELRRYFAARRELSAERGRSTRHLCSNLRQIPGDGMRLAATITVFSGTGPRPISLGAPSSLADFGFDCVETAQGWRFREVTGRLVFAGPDTPDLAKAASAVRGPQP